MPIVDKADGNDLQKQSEHHGFAGEFGINFVQAVAAPVKGCAQLAGYDVASPPAKNTALTGAEMTGKMLGSGMGNAVLYVGSTALMRELPGGVGVRNVIVGGALGFLSPIDSTDSDSKTNPNNFTHTRTHANSSALDGLGARTMNAVMGATTNAILGLGSGSAAESAVGNSFVSSLKRTTISSGMAGLFNTQAESLMRTGRPADFAESVSGAVTWAATGAAFHGLHGVGAAWRSRSAVPGEVVGSENTLASLGKTAAFVRNPERELQMAKDFSADMQAGVALQQEVGPWIAVLGSSAPKPGSPTYRSAFEVGRLVATDLKMPVATGNGPGVMAGANEGAFANGGKSVGIYLEGLPSEQNQNPFTTNAIRCKTLLARQHLLLSGADGLVIAPEGGGGTVFEYTHQLIEMRRKVYNPNTPIVFVDENKMWGGLHGWFARNVVSRGLMRGSEFDHTFFANSPTEAIGILRRELNLPGDTVVPFTSRKSAPVLEDKAVARAG